MKRTHLREEVKAALHQNGKKQMKKQVEQVRMRKMRSCERSCPDLQLRKVFQRSHALPKPPSPGGDCPHTAGNVSNETSSSISRRNKAHGVTTYLQRASAQRSQHSHKRNLLVWKEKRSGKTYTWYYRRCQRPFS